MSNEAVILGTEYGTPAILRPIYGPLLDNTLRWFGWASVPTATRIRLDENLTRSRADFAEQIAEDEAIECSNLGEHGMAQVPDPCCCREHAGSNLCPDCPEHGSE